MSSIPLIFTSGWASGINCYVVVLLLGLLGRYGHASAVPATLERTDVLIFAAVLLACQFFAGKIPYLDSVWDLVHTGIRPLVGGAIGVLMAQHAHGSLTVALAAAATGGGTSLVTHLTKSGIRLGVNTSPEPLTNIIVGFLEDVVAAGIVVFALLQPLLAAAIAAFLLLASVLVAVLLIRRILRFWRDRRARRRYRQPAAASRTWMLRRAVTSGPFSS